MGTDHPAFLQGETEVPSGIPQCREGMTEPMKPMAFMGMVPVIEIIVMKQGSDDQASVVEFQVMFLGIAIGIEGDSETVIIHAERTMGLVGFHGSEGLLLQDRPSPLSKEMIWIEVHAISVPADIQPLFLRAILCQLH